MPFLIFLNFKFFKSNFRSTFFCNRRREERSWEERRRACGAGEEEEEKEEEEEQEEEKRHRVGGLERHSCGSQRLALPGRDARRHGVRRSPLRLRSSRPLVRLSEVPSPLHRRGLRQRVLQWYGGEEEAGIVLPRLHLGAVQCTVHALSVHHPCTIRS